MCELIGSRNLTVQLQRCQSGVGQVKAQEVVITSHGGLQGQFRVRMSSAWSHVIQVTALNCPVEIGSSGLRRRRRRRRWVSTKSCDRYLRGDNRYVKGTSEIAESHARHLRSQECGGCLSPEHIITVVMADRVYRGEPHQGSPTRACTHACTHVWRTLPDSAGT